MVKILYYELNGFRLPFEMEATTFFLTLTGRGSSFWDAANLRQMVESKTRRAPNLSMITGSGNMDFLFGLDLNLHCMSSFACRLLSIRAQGSISIPSIQYVHLL